ncbi:MAG: gluconate 2-dehydrogenase subunit 3 family protein [Gemmatimonadaceae bacterium]
MTESSSRRDFVQRLGAVGALWMLGARGEGVPADSDAGPDLEAPPTLRFFTPAEGRVVEAIAERIIPSDDGPGAKEAGVLYFIDRGLVTFARDLQGPVRNGLADLAKRVSTRHAGVTNFAQLSPEQRDAILHDMEGTEFFGTVRSATIAGMFALPSYGGNRNYVGWRAIGFGMAMEYAPPFGYYDRPEIRQQLLGREGE